MDIRLCEELVVLSESLSFRKASERLFLTQSTLSKHVAAAEHEVGFRIFERSSQGVELTAGGRVLVEELRQLTGHYERALHQARASQAQQDASVRIAGPLLNSRIAAIVFRAMLRDESVQASMMETGVRDCQEKLLAREADIAIAFRYESVAPGLRYEHLFDIPFGIACHNGNPLARKPVLTFDDLVGVPMISYPLQGREDYHAFVRAVRKRHGISTAIEHLEPGASCYPRTMESVIFGVHFPDYSRFVADFVARPLDDVSDQFDLCVLCRTDETRPAVLSLFDAIVAGARGQN